MLRDKAAERHATYLGIQGQKPRKKIKLELVEKADEYNQFGGQIEEQRDDADEPVIQKEQVMDLSKQQHLYQSFLGEIKKNPRNYRKLNQKPSQNSQNNKQAKEEPHIKNNQKANNQKTKKNQNNKQQTIPTNSNSNWAAFLKNNPVKKVTHQNNYDFVAIDCQFVRAEEKQCLARISIVSEKNQVLFDAYAKPKQKITDYLTSISGITYGHIKNAKSAQEVLTQAKTYMLNKIVIGHTLYKDLQVCKLANWKGFKGKIDIAESKVYTTEQGKKISLKNLSYKYLGERIQEGSHSSAQDAIATMKLFLKQKVALLKENKLVRK